ncbi:hypothetical protein WN944_023165 [Citrus x changshan-huyou]|uniref:Uncharacterized protein n=1 Tax=Citrus x changshan-huyou TaxID=2935761 RepID=A0AAP0N1Y0_9ROSI
MQDVKAKAAESEELILSEYIAEPALPQELRESFYEFQKQVEEIWYIRTLAAKYRIREKEIGNRFDSELNRIPSSGR